jgi:hypothetical protein
MDTWCFTHGPKLFPMIKGKVFVIIASILLIIFFISLEILFAPQYCYLQLVAANSDPHIITGKNNIFYGSASYVLINIYYAFSIIFITLPIRYLITGRFRELLIRDLKYSITPLAIITSIIIGLYTYIIYNTGYSPNVYMFLIHSLFTAIMVEALIIYVIIYGIPATIINGHKKRIILGLTASIPSGIAAFFIALTTRIFPLTIYECSAEAYGINIVNPNTKIIEESIKVTIPGIIATITWYILYMYIIYYEVRHYMS